MEILARGQKQCRSMLCIQLTAIEDAAPPPPAKKNILCLPIITAGGIAVPKSLPPKYWIFFFFIFLNCENRNKQPTHLWKHGVVPQIHCPRKCRPSNNLNCKPLDFKEKGLTAWSWLCWELYDPGQVALPHGLQSQGDGTWVTTWSQRFPNLSESG